MFSGLKTFHLRPLQSPVLWGKFHYFLSLLKKKFLFWFFFFFFVSIVLNACSRLAFHHTPCSWSTRTLLKQPIFKGEKGTATHRAVHQETVTLLLEQFHNRGSAGEFSGNLACSRAPHATEGAGVVLVYL